MKIASLTVLALIGFAFNSILCRMALRGDEADFASFTAVRLASGAVMLIILSYFFSKKMAYPKGGSWMSALFLFAYAICFTFSYLGLTAGTGALILFGSVQLTMIAVSRVRGEKPRPLEWLGLITALAGLVYLVYPGLASPPLNSSLLMSAAGGAWGMYTLRGRGSGDPLGDTTGNFVRTLPFAAVALLIFLPNLHLSTFGILLAVLSGAAASGMGYAIWYRVLKHHAATRAAVMQLSVPVLVSVLGIVMLGERATLRLGIAGLLILGGIAITVARKR
jgi:drug/metabolite transporter (DMT)-like permease